ncbi:MAG TPA: glycosyltransferase family 4 protein [Gammaproteobacteria bacterium]|nr:glycosyltransferase family 4 protein [Gammaproteobacteria bacterium]
MKIAQVSPLYESVPPKTYGGTERVVHYLTEELVRLGHQVTLFASGDSRTRAELRPIVPEALRLSRVRRDPTVWHTLLLAAVAREAHNYDVIHFHTDFLHFPLCRLVGTPQLTTLHGRLDLPDLQAVYAEFHDQPVVSISDAQRAPLPQAQWLATVYNGVPAECYDFRAEGGDYLVFLGRISPEKGAEAAIEIALRAGLPLKIAAKIDVVDEAYFKARIQPHLGHPLIEYVGEVDERGKNELLGGARALLLPLAWPEPFGLVMIEAMACGTPVIAYRRGAVPEVVADGISGYIVDGPEEAVAAVERLDRLDRHTCRRYFERRFSARQMAERYLRAYAGLLERYPALSLKAG